MYWDTVIERMSTSPDQCCYEKVVILQAYITLELFRVAEVHTKPLLSRCTELNREQLGRK